MGDPRFASLAESKRWLADDVIAEAIAPVLAFLHPGAVPELRAYLGDLLAIHPVVRTLFTRAAKLHTIPSFDRVDKAARLAGEEEEEDSDEDRENERAIPSAPKAKHKLDRLLTGLPDLANPVFKKVAEDVIKRVARRVSRQWRRRYDEEHVKELIGVGWVVAVEASHKWDPTEKAAFSTFLWQIARCRMIDYEKKPSHRYETPMSGISSADISRDSLKAESPETELRRLAAEGATSWMLGSLHRIPETPEEKVTRAFQDERIKALVGELEENEQKILSLVFEEDMSCRQAAERLGVSARTAAYWQTSAIGKLRKRLDQSSNVSVLRRRHATA